MTSSSVRVVLFSLLFSGLSHADVAIHAPAGGTLTFSAKKTGEHYANDSWGKILFSSGSFRADLTQTDRSYTEDGSSTVSPSGRYLVVNSVSGGELTQEDGSVTWSDRAYCSVVDMRNGCVVSDWSGEACGYTWVGSEDRLADSTRPDAQTFDFKSMRPTLQQAKSDFAVMDRSRVMNILRCDAPVKDNINDYQRLAKDNNAVAKVIHGAVVNYLTRLTITATVTAKTPLFDAAQAETQTKAYLVAGDKVKVIQRSADNQWLNIGYINAKGTPRVAWIRAESIIKRS